MAMTPDDVLKMIKDKEVKFVDVRFPQALRAALPIYVVFFAAIAFAIFFPEVVLWLPKHVIPSSVGCFRNPNGPGFICP